MITIENRSYRYNWQGRTATEVAVAYPLLEMTMTEVQHAAAF